MNKFIRQLLPFGTLLFIIAGLSALAPDTFLTAENFFNVLSRSSVNGIIAMGMTAVIISGGIDLSVGSMMALCGMVAGLIMTRSGGPAARRPSRPTGGRRGPRGSAPCGRRR